MSEKKVVGKNIFIATLIICIAVSIGLVSVLVTYLPVVSNLESQLVEKDQELTNLNTTITNLSLQTIALQEDLDQANAAVALLQGNYQSVIDSYLNIIYLQTSGYLLNQAGFSQNGNETTQVFYSELEYAGYVSVNVESNSTTTYVQVIYDSYGVNFNQKITIGESGSTAFPILPGEVEINIGNEESINGVSCTTTINYVY